MKSPIIKGTITWRAQLPAYPSILDVFLDLDEASCLAAGVTRIQIATYYVGDDEREMFSPSTYTMADLHEKHLQGVPLDVGTYSPHVFLTVECYNARDLVFPLGIGLFVVKGKQVARIRTHNLWIVDENGDELSTLVDVLEEM